MEASHSQLTIADIPAIAAQGTRGPSEYLRMTMGARLNVWD
jgi:hypothetical protein